MGSRKQRPTCKTLESCFWAFFTGPVISTHLCVLCMAWVLVVSVIDCMKKKPFNWNVSEVQSLYFFCPTSDAFGNLLSCGVCMPWLVVHGFVVGSFSPFVLHVGCFGFFGVLCVSFGLKPLHLNLLSSVGGTKEPQVLHIQDSIADCIVGFKNRTRRTFYIYLIATLLLHTCVLHIQRAGFLQLFTVVHLLLDMVHYYLFTRFIKHTLFKHLNNDWLLY